MDKFSEFFFEKYVLLGLIETIELDGLGTFAAKLDTGNGAFNVIHGTDVEIDPDNKVVRFTSINSIQLEKDIVDTIDIHIGENEIKTRYVVQFDMVMGDFNIKNVKFSIADRSMNEYKILLSKNFIQKLKGIVQPNSDNLADKNILIDY